MRRSYIFVFEMVTLGFLTHGEGNAGNQQILRTQSALVPGEDGHLEKIEVPEVSGAAMRATLREHAVMDYADLAGIEEMSQDRLRLLLKGGRNDAGGINVPITEMREMRRKAPLLALWGAMDGGYPLRGALTVSPVRVFCRELVDARLQPTEYTPPEGTGEPIRIFQGIAPIAVADCRGILQNYKHDMRSSEAGKLLEGAVYNELEDRSAARAEMKVADKEIRRAANESMPYSFQGIVPGTPMICEIRANQITDIELGCLQRAIARWIASGAFLGGGASAGRGRCQVREIHGWQIASLNPIPAGSSTALLAKDQPASALYAEEIRKNAAEIRDWLSEDKGGPKEPKAAKGKKGKKDAEATA